MDIININALLAEGSVVSTLDPSDFFVLSRSNAASQGNNLGYKTLIISKTDLAAALGGGSLALANNGLSVSGGTTVQMGGPLVKNTSIDSAGFDFSLVDSNNNFELLQSTNDGRYSIVGGLSGNTYLNANQPTNLILFGGANTISSTFGAAGGIVLIGSAHNISGSTSDTWLFGDYGDVTDSIIINSFGRSNTFSTSDNIINIGVNNTITGSSALTVVGQNSIITDSAKVYLANNNFFAVLDNAGYFGVGTTTPIATITTKGSTNDNTASAFIAQDSLAATLFQIRNDGDVFTGRNFRYLTINSNFVDFGHNGGIYLRSTGTYAGINAQNGFIDINTAADHYIQGDNTGGLRPWVIRGDELDFYQSANGMGSAFKVDNENGAVDTVAYFYSSLGVTSLGIGIQAPLASLHSVGNKGSLFRVQRSTVGLGLVATSATTTLTGTGTQFTKTLAVGDVITVSGETARTVATITNDTTLDVTVAFANTAGGLTYAVTGDIRFDVWGNGTIEAGSLTGTNQGSLSIGFGATNLGLTSINNTIVGMFAAGGLTGNYNAAFGTSALGSATGASRNVAMGVGALGAATTGFGCIGIGFSAGQGITTGQYTTAVGYNTLTANTNGGNTAVGGEAGVGTTGAGLTFVGYAVFGQATSGDYNTGVGQGVMFRNNTGSRNTGLGYGAGHYNIAAGSDNVYIGYEAGYYNNDAGNNTGTVGRNQNVIIGSAAGINYSGSGSVIIGYQAGGSLISGDNKLVIDNADTATPLIYGDFSTNEVAFRGSIATADPGSGAGKWKLGQVTAAAVALDAANYVEVDIDGAIVKLGIVV